MVSPRRSLRGTVRLGAVTPTGCHRPAIDAGHFACVADAAPGAFGGAWRCRDPKPSGTMIFLRSLCYPRIPRVVHRTRRRSNDDAPDSEERPDQAVISFHGVLTGADGKARQLA